MVGTLSWVCFNQEGLFDLSESAPRTFSFEVLKVEVPIRDIKFRYFVVLTRSKWAKHVS